MLRTVAAAAGMNLVLQVTSVILGVLLSVVLSRLLGAQGLGIYAFGFSTAMLLATFSGLGLSSLIVREVAVGQERGDWPSVVGLVAWGQRAVATSSTTLGLLATVAAFLFADPTTFQTVAIAMIMLVVMTGTTLRCRALRGLNAVVVANVPLNLVRPAVALGAVGVLFASSAPTPQAAMAAQALAWVAAAAVAAFYWQRRLPVRPTTQVRTPGPWLKAALPLFILDGLLVTVHESDIVMLKWLSTDASTGIYSITVQLGRFIAIILMVANSVVSPRFAALHTAGKTDSCSDWSARARGPSPCLPPYWLR